ncbi:hypothetical protein HBH70_151840 [Parastagonospora nodorum]|nr:hypothetical protein HBH51_151150 [Parastagonospora nodorum]KAH3977431.1 hypothetical protein HBH52_111470 [Parastagonospora nodorum]KAH3999918.1 hypothetical protein HBI10_110320 [Parastagonospora nodorum]KAH4022155.1 hypothetical protein HBI13_098880 [Parastagonospora nodorum]KAH4027842.1 hypothetical protein HBI09_143960 [Parastagonospora nodorum]
MAAATHAVRKLDAATDDIMDLHSDSGLDFDDGDIDLDLDPAPPAQADDDDISLKDAGADADLETQTVSPDQDMVDHEVDDEGDIQLGDGIHDDHVPIDYTTPAQETAPAHPDDDLIDYSDDEDIYPTPTYNQGTPAQSVGQTQDVQNDESASEIHALPAEAQIPGSTNEDEIANHGDYADGEDNFEPSAENEEQHDENNFEPSAENQEQHDETEFRAQDEAEYDTDGDTGGVPLQDQDSQADVSEYQQGDHVEQQSIESRPITINYEGNELWLFKQHDVDESGDWLTEDTSIIHSSLSEMFQACRASLGENISNEAELGLRFDHFHNMEIFEDSTACVAVSLGRMIDLYYTLHAQDGESEPESFYMCLLSRPRFATLLSDIAKHADQGHGYSGLNSAIAAGETHFVDAHSGQSTEHEGTEWDQDAEGQEEYGQKEETEQEENVAQENAQEGTEIVDEAADEAATGIDLGENDDQDNDEPRVNGEEHSSKAETKSEHASTPAAVAHGSSPAAQESPDRSAETTQHDVTANQTAEQLANDTVDYSDDEDDEPQTQAPTNASPSSTTVQGDNPATIEASAPTAEPTSFEEEYQTGYDDAFPDAANGAYEDYAHNEEQFDHENNADMYQEYDGTYGEGEASDLQTNDQDAYPAEADLDGLTNQDYTGYDYQDLEQQLQNEFISGGEVDGTGAGESANGAHELVDGDDFLDLENATEWGTDQGQAVEVSGDNIFLDDEVTAHYEEEEGGVVEQPAVAASSAADPVAASSTDLQDSSPQGQKRSRDEASDSVGDALDPSDTKRPRV